MLKFRNIKILIKIFKNILSTLNLYEQYKTNKTGNLYTAVVVSPFVGRESNEPVNNQSTVI